MTDESRSTPHDAIEVGGAVWLRSGEATLGGAARIALLAAIQQTGSITGAAKAVGMSYKAAWDAIDTMNNLAGTTLVVRATGGKGGGGTTLTAKALRLIDTYRVIEREHQAFLERAGAAIEGFVQDWRLIGRIGMKTSARNQLFGTVSQVTRGSVNDEVELRLSAGQSIVAVVTHESTESLGLKEGVEASWVMLMVDDAEGSSGPMRVSARNQLRGKVSSVTPGAVNAEVSLALDDATTVTAVITNESVTTLGLVQGQAAIAAFKASSVILGVTD